MINIILSAVLLLTVSLSGFAQKMLKGKVIDAVSGKPLHGASVTFSGSGGIATDQEGNFSIDCSKSQKVTITFVGYEPYTFIIKNCDAEMRISLEPSGQTLNNVEISATSNLNKALLYQPASINKLTPLELKRGTGLFLDDAIQIGRAHV